MEKVITDLFSQYAYSPWLVHGAMWGFMTLSAFGLPLPEEAVLVSVGFAGYMGMNPKLYPPPYPGAVGINIYVLAISAFCAVIFSDLLIYGLGRKFGPSLFQTRFFSRLMAPSRVTKVQRWTQSYGYWTVILFRFTPGIRFPGHMMCGAMGVTLGKFLAVDGIAAGLSVPTQVLLVCFYGHYILKYFGEFKFYLFGAAVIGLAIFFTQKVRKVRREEELKKTQDAESISSV